MRTTPEYYFKTPLKPHQKEAYEKIITYGTEGFLDADSMGLGKTLVMFYAIVRRVLEKQREHKTCRVLIVQPKSVIGELQKQMNAHFSERIDELLSVYEYCTTKRSTKSKRAGALREVQRQCRGKSKALVTLVSYGIATNDAGTLYKQKRKYRWHYVFFDECQTLKNPETKQAKAVLRNLSKHTVRVGLSGTPCNNSPKREMSGLSRVLFPTLPELHDVKSYATGTPLALRIRLIRRKSLKAIGIVLPPMRVQKCELQMDTDSPAAKVYDEKLSNVIQRWMDYLRASKTFPALRQMMFTAWQGALQQLLQSTTHPNLSEVRKGDMTCEQACAEGSVKLSKTLELVATHGRRKMIVTSASVQFLRLVDYALKHTGNTSNAVLFTGQLTQDQRKKSLNKWRDADSGVNVLLLSMKAGGVGLTLTEAHTMVIVDTCYNPVHAEQVKFRVYRMGLEHPVNVFKLYVRGTVDQVLRDSVHPSKRQASNELLGTCKKTKVSVTELQCVTRQLRPAWEMEIRKQKGGQALQQRQREWSAEKLTYEKARKAKRAARLAALAADGAALYAARIRKRTRELRHCQNMELNTEEAPRKKQRVGGGAL